MSKQKFQIGDKVVVNDKYSKQSYGIGTVVDVDRTIVDDEILIPADTHEPIHTPSTRKLYEVVFEEGGIRRLFYSYELKKCINSKFHVGDEVILTEKAKKWLGVNGIKINPNDVYTIREVTSFYGHSYKYKLSRITGTCFFDDDLELYDESKEGLTIGEVMYNPRDEIMFTYKQRVDRMKRWVDICNEYLREFCDRHDYAYHPCDWIGGEVGGIIEISDMFVTMDNIRYDVDNEIPVDKFSDWYWNSVEHSELGLKYMNYPSYCKGAPDPYTQEQIQSIREGQLRISKAKEDLRKMMNEIGGDFSKLLF